MRIPIAFSACWMALALPVEAPPAAAQEPPNPFGAARQRRPDAVAGRLELSDGKTIRGKIYLTRGHRLRIYDAEKERFRDVPLRVVKAVRCIVQKEWNEKEWRFKGNANDAKVLTGRTYPARIYEHEIELRRGDRIRGPLAALVFIQPDEPLDGPGAARGPPKPKKYVLHKRHKGRPGTKLKDLVYVKRIVLGADDAERAEEGTGRKKGAAETQ